MLQRLAKIFEKGKEIPLNGEEVVLTREPNARFGYRIVEDWEDTENDTYRYFTAVDMNDFPIVFPGSEVGVSGQTEEEVRSRMLDTYPNAREMKKEWM